MSKVLCAYVGCRNRSAWKPNNEQMLAKTVDVNAKLVLFTAASCEQYRVNQNSQTRRGARHFLKFPATKQHPQVLPPPCCKIQTAVITKHELLWFGQSWQALQQSSPDALRFSQDESRYVVAGLAGVRSPVSYFNSCMHAQEARQHSEGSLTRYRTCFHAFAISAPTILLKTKRSGPCWHPGWHHERGCSRLLMLHIRIRSSNL